MSTFTPLGSREWSNSPEMLRALAARQSTDDKIRNAKVSNWRDDVRADDVLGYMYDTGAFGYTTCYVRVLKVCPRMYRVQFEHGAVAYKRPSYFTSKASVSTLDAKTAQRLGF